MRKRLERFLLGAPRSIHDPAARHKISLIALLAWGGLGADGVSSFAYPLQRRLQFAGLQTMGLSVRVFSEKEAA